MTRLFLMKCTLRLCMLFLVKPHLVFVTPSQFVTLRCSNTVVMRCFFGDLLCEAPQMDLVLESESQGSTRKRSKRNAGPEVNRDIFTRC